jgi:hypothetical protein
MHEYYALVLLLVLVLLSALSRRPPFYFSGDGILAMSVLLGWVGLGLAHFSMA